MVIYVDDDRDDQMLFQEIVSSYGKEMLVFGRSDEFLSLLNQPPGEDTLVFLDLNMPIRTGEEVLSMIKSSELWKNVPVVILSTSISEVTITNCRNVGAKLYIVKATDFSRLKTSIDYALGIDFRTFEPDDRSFVYFEIP
ncbi:MAG: response regulator [Flavobacterium sp.]|uniref:response regulator n=1 Tax=Flavobacterium sp. TaxID=239 RepID=UPI001220211B|nr:response regulator [Flavobacterium sp.]RZJ65963.1 MAG: response regulator [Flavobacterium sp.]